MWNGYSAWHLSSGLCAEVLHTARQFKMAAVVGRVQRCCAWGDELHTLGQPREILALTSSLPHPLLRRCLESSPRSGLSRRGQILQQELLLLCLSLLLNQSQSPSTGLNDTWQENNYGPNEKVPVPSAPISVLKPWETASLFRWGPQASSPFLSSLRLAGNKLLQ